MSEKEYKIFRDPIHGNIKIFPFELKIIDLRIFQRLRYLKQTPSVGYVFHSANHTRFEHSIGSLHIAEMYARSLDIPDSDKELLRLCALLHDIAHGIFSHLYDDIVYKEIYPEEKHGHDIHRMKIIKEYLPEVLLETYNEEELRETIELSGLDNYLTSNTKESVQIIMNKVAETLTSKGTVHRNIIHGPLGCDRMDFVKRDSYFSGTGHYGGFPLDRIIQFSSEDDEILCYSSKILDDIILFLINRFHMYKNVYFHKTCRALDLMFKQMLRYSMGPLKLVERTSNLREYEKLNELSFFNEISYCYQRKFDDLKEKISRKNIYNNEQEIKKKILDYLYGRLKIDDFYSEVKIGFEDCKEENLRNELKMLKNIFNAHELVNRVLERDLYENVVDEAIALTKEEIKKRLDKDEDFNPGDETKKDANEWKKVLAHLYVRGEGGECPELLIDTPYEIIMSPLEELPRSKIDIHDEKDGKTKKYHEIENERNFKTWDLASFNIFRIYTTSNTEKEKLKLYVEKTRKIIKIRKAKRAKMAKRAKKISAEDVRKNRETDTSY